MDLLSKLNINPISMQHQSYTILVCIAIEINPQVFVPDQFAAV